MIPLSDMPGFARWGRNLAEVVALGMPIWVYGEAGTGVSCVAAWLASQRGSELQDDAERLDPASLDLWLRAHPRGVVASHRGPEEPLLAGLAACCVPLRIPSLEEEPGVMEACLMRLAEEEGLVPPWPPALGALPCPGNLRGLRNRLVRWRLLGQLPEDGPGGPLPLEAEDLASNLHVLERLLLHRALRRSYGNRVEAARRLGVSRRQLYLLIARHGDPVRGEVPTSEGPKRLGKQRMRQNSSPGRGHR